jgi:flavodoxin
MNILILYFSKTGHTRHAAEVIQHTVGGDLSELDTLRTYAKSYGMTVIQGGIEQLGKKLPKLEPLAVDIGSYDFIFLGAPVWWFSPAPAMKSFLASVNLSGKTVCPFVTSGGSPSDSLKELTDKLQEIGANVKEGLAISWQKEKQMTPDEDIAHWAAESVK